MFYGASENDGHQVATPVNGTNWLRGTLQEWKEKVKYENKKNKIMIIEIMTIFVT